MGVQPYMPHDCQMCFFKGAACGSDHAEFAPPAPLVPLKPPAPDMNFPGPADWRRLVQGSWDPGIPTSAAGVQFNHQLCGEAVHRTLTAVHGEGLMDRFSPLREKGLPFGGLEVELTIMGLQVRIIVGE